MRASNELMYVRNVGDAVWAIERNQQNLQAQYDEYPNFLKRPGRLEEMNRDRRNYRREDHAIDSILLSALSHSVDDLRNRLKHNFEVRMVNEIMMRWAGDARKLASRPYHVEPDRLIGWEIGNVEERIRAEDRADLERLNTLCPRDAFVSAWADADAKKRTGPPASRSTKDLRVSALLKKRGYPTLTPAVVARYAHRLRQFEPGTLRDVETHPSDVIPFKRPNGSSDDNGPDAA